MANVLKIDDNERRKAILDFISNNQGCNKQCVVNYFDANERNSRGHSSRSKLDISKKTIYRIIGELVNEGLVREERERSNSRDLKLYVDTTNLLITIPNELDKFETDFIKLLDAVKRRTEEKEEDGAFLLHYALNIFSELFNIYNYHALLIWPRQIGNKSYLNKLYLLVFTKIMEMHVEILNRFRTLIPDEEYLRDGIDNLIPTNLANALLACPGEKEVMLMGLSLADYGLGKQTEPLISHLININSLIKPTEVRHHEFIRQLRR